ncbi:hypothetical protein [Endozoicomonas sp. Mp262]|uniref:hypothetical protein n=1 Tax=Endozoicomonas sp. Mp262 TaxID=2919499 RepID=UPI0021D9BF23
MDIVEESAKKQLDISKNKVQEALSLMEAVSSLKNKLHIKEGCGARYIQNTKPNKALLQQAEHAILTHYSPSTSTPTSRKKKKTNLIQAMRRKGMA